MSVSTNGQICYGLLFEEDYKFPWDDKKYDDGIHDWWLEQCGYTVDDSEYPYTADGEYKVSLNADSKITKNYYIKKHEFRRRYPAPFELVNVCSAEYPIYILAIKESVKIARRGYPEKIDCSNMIIKNAWAMDLCYFCEKYNLEPEDITPQWYLSSYTDSLVKKFI